MVQECKGRFFFQGRFIGRRHGDPFFFGGVLDQLGFGDIQEIEQFVKTIEHGDGLFARFRPKPQPFFRKPDVPRLHAVDLQALFAKPGGQPGHFRPVFPGLFRHDDRNAAGPFPPDRLQQAFKEFADKQIDIELIGALKPTYEPEPLVDASGRLVVKGWFPTDPMRVAFSLDFIPSDGEWKLISINVKTVDSPPAAQPSTPKQ